MRLITLVVLVFATLQLQASDATRPAALDRLVRMAEETGSDTLYVSVDGKPVVDWSRGERKPIELMSALKSVVAIAIGRLLHDGALKSLDEPVHSFYPEWKQGRKKAITVRHLLNHTSGIQNVPNAGAEIYPAPNAIQLALAAELTSEPGAEFSYNNKAVNLLAGIIEKASGLRMDLYFAEKLFAPLKITEFQWHYDRSGQPHAMAGLRLHAADAAKFGQLVLAGGLTGTTRLLPEAYVTEMLAPGQQKHPLAGLLWWRYVRDQTVTFRSTLPAALSDALRAQMQPLTGERYTSRRAARAALHTRLGAGYEQSLTNLLGADWFNALFDWRIGAVEAYYAEGSLGQYIVVVPDARVVAVRQVASRPGLNETTTFGDFPAEVAAYAQSLR